MTHNCVCYIDQTPPTMPREGKRLIIGFLAKLYRGLMTECNSCIMRSHSTRPLTSWIRILFKKSQQNLMKMKAWLNRVKFSPCYSSLRQSISRSGSDYVLRSRARLTVEWCHANMVRVGYELNTTKHWWRVSSHFDDVFATSMTFASRKRCLADSLYRIYYFVTALGAKPKIFVQNCWILRVVYSR